MTKNKPTGVIGIDEVGRGPLAGPVTVCAVYLNDEIMAKELYFDNSIRDSKKLSLARRNNVYLIIRKNRKLNNIDYAVSNRSSKHIDKHGINNSIHSCIVSCLIKLEKKGVKINHVKINLDGGLKIKMDNLDQSTHIRGDESYVHIALASIIAKISRDKYMQKVASKCKGYDFENNVGYGTKKHIIAIKKMGITKYHRISYLSRIISIRKNLK
ncbi:MAG: ribonuclease HII [Candidatus Nomurabacteria bacterium]